MAALFALAFALAFFGNGARRPLDAHEVFVARTAVEMQRRDDYLVPYFDAHARLQKPPLNYWLTLAAERILPAGGADVPEIGARLPSILLGALTVVLTACLGLVLFESLSIGLLGALLFATSNAYLEWSRSAQPEMSYTFACTAFVCAVAAAWRASAAGRGTWRLSACAWIALAIAILAKGPILPVLLLAAAAIALRKRAGGPGFAKTLHAATGLVLLLALVVPYFAIIAAHVPDAVGFWRSQMFNRVGGLGEAWWKPFELYYVFQLLELCLPWSALLVLALIQLVRERSNLPAARFLLWCVLVPTVALSFSAGRKGYYLLPILPLLGLSMAWACARVFEQAREHASAARTLLRGARAHAVVFALASVALIVVVFVKRPWLGLGNGALLAAVAALSFAIGSAVWSFLEARRAPKLAAALLLVSATLGGMAVGGSGIESRITRYSNGAFARAVAAAAAQEAPLIAIDGDAQVLLFYTDREILRAEPEELARELESRPEAWIVEREHAWSAREIPGRIIVREALPEDDDPLVLLEPAPHVRAALGSPGPSH